VGSFVGLVLSYSSMIVSYHTSTNTALVTVLYRTAMSDCVVGLGLRRGPFGLVALSWEGAGTCMVGEVCGHGMIIMIGSRFTIPLGGSAGNERWGEGRCGWVCMQGLKDRAVRVSYHTFGEEGVFPPSYHTPIIVALLGLESLRPKSTHKKKREVVYGIIIQIAAALLRIVVETKI